MGAVINIKLWNENVAAVAWDKEKEFINRIQENLMLKI